MIQQTTQTVWGYGYGMARTVGRTTYIGEGPEPDPADPANYTTLGPMVFRRVGLGRLTVDLDVQGRTYIRYISARILFSSNDDLQAQAVIDPDPTVPPGSRLLVQIWDVAGGADAPADLTPDSALCIEVVTNQPGEPDFSVGPQIAP